MVFSTTPALRVSHSYAPEIKPPDYATDSDTPTTTMPTVATTMATTAATTSTTAPTVQTIRNKEITHNVTIDVSCG